MRRLKEIVEFILAVLYALFLNLSNRLPRRVVIYFHGINKADAVGFRRKMAYLAKKCFVVSPSNIKTAKVNGTDNVVAITFDDAYVSVVKKAVPILEEYGLPAGVFVPTGNLGYRPRWTMSEDCPDEDEMVMTKEQIAELDRKGFEIFSHTVSHQQLTEIEDDTLLAELKNSKQFLEKVVGHEVIGISYPYGIYDNRVCRTAEKCGYMLGFTIKPYTVDDTTDPFKIGRFSVSPRDSLAKFKLKVSGAYQAVILLRKLKRMLLRV